MALLKKLTVRFLLSLLSLSLAMVSLFAAQESQPTQAAPLAIKLPESKEFATQVLADPWDMNQFSDISQYLNESGQYPYIVDFSVENGIFKGTANNFWHPLRNEWIIDPQFFVLFPGYYTASLLEKIGENYPINASTYRCLYMAMKVESGKGVDQFQVFWYEDERLNSDGGRWGQSKGQVLYPESPLYDPTQNGTISNPWVYKLYRYDLADNSQSLGPNFWTSLSQWKGIRIDPTIQETDFEVDWVRLTNCSAVNLPDAITWTGGDAKIWIRPQGTTREILLGPRPDQTFVTPSFKAVSSPFNPDLQGVAPGAYDILVRRSTDGALLKTVAIEINQAFTAEYVRPSFISGQDYSTSSGAAWDFSESSDITSVQCSQYNFNTPGVISLMTREGENQPSGCYGVEGSIVFADPKIILNTPATLYPDQFRYLSWTMQAVRNVQNVPGGMIVRWIWSTDSYTRPNQGYRCHMVSQDMPFDVGTHTYSVDLFDVFQGSVEEVAGDCPPASSLDWQSSKPILDLRFDPNENVVLGDFSQYIDQIYLTKPDQVTIGEKYLIQIHFNRPVQEITSLLISLVKLPSTPPLDTFDSALVNAQSQGLPAPTLQEYLTTSGTLAYSRQVIDPASLSMEVNPTAALQTLAGGSVVYIPMATNNWSTALDEYTLLENWSTIGMQAGDYQVCITVDDDYNQLEWCSEAFLRVVP